ncbi:unnamed protein product, partial [Vitis vinifera]
MAASTASAALSGNPNLTSSHKPHASLSPHSCLRFSTAISRKFPFKSLTTIPFTTATTAASTRRSTTVTASSTSFHGLCYVVHDNIDTDQIIPAEAVVAESYARIFFRNSVSTGEVYPLETEVRICEECRRWDFRVCEEDRDDSRPNRLEFELLVYCRWVEKGCNLSRRSLA